MTERLTERGHISRVRSSETNRRRGEAILLIVHIGPGRSGSTSIQTTLGENRQALARQGVVWPDAALENSCNFRALAEALSAGQRTAALDGLLQCIAANPHARVVVSSEFLWKVGPDGTRFLRQMLPPEQPTRIVLYLRPYGEWLQSLYLHRPEGAESEGGFDRFFARRGTRYLTVRRAVTAWATAFGTEAIAVRYTADLPRRDAAADFVHVIGAELRTIPRRAQSRSWLIGELARAMVAHEATPGALMARRHAFERWLSRVGAEADTRRIPTEVRYLTTAQEQALSEQFAADAQWLNEYAGVPLPSRRPTPERTERPFLPSIETTPPAFRALLANILDRSNLRIRDPYIAATLAKVLGRAL